MKNYNYLLIFFSLILFSCGNKQGTISKFLNSGALPNQVFSVDINRDTTLLTTNGCIIKLPKGTLQSESGNVKLEIKEALSNTDIVLAGLTTMSGKQPLSSGGMIYINAAQGYKVEIKKQLEILVPTKNYNPAMQVFKGKEKDAGKIDWIEPIDLPKDETLIKINKGEQLFKANCTSCHKIDKDFTGPALAGVTDRRPKQWLYDFTRNPQKKTRPADTIATDSLSDSPQLEPGPDFYSACLYHKWNNTQMTAFANLTDADLDALYAYIKTEGDKLKPFGTDTTIKDCCDSCDAYGKAMFAVYKEHYKELIYPATIEEQLFTLDREIPIPATPQPVETSSQPSPNSVPKPFTKVTPTSVSATYYTINIKTFGWYNIDILMKDYSKCEPSELFVRLQGTYETDVNVVLVIPSVKAFVEGGKLKDGKKYGFDENDGSIPLPQNAQCYVMAFAEYKDKIVFGKTVFTAQKKQTISISMAETTNELMKAQINGLNLDDVKLEVSKKIIPTIANDSIFDTKMKEVMKLRPTNCACGFDLYDH